MYWAGRQGLDARPLHMIGYGDEAEDDGVAVADAAA